MNTITNTKAMQVEQAYYDAAWGHNTHSEGCYALAVDAAHNLGGVEIYNSNDHDDSAKSLAPSITFTFDDASTAYVTYGGVFL